MGNNIHEQIGTGKEKEEENEALILQRKVEDIIQRRLKLYRKNKDSSNEMNSHAINLAEKLTLAECQRYLLYHVLIGSSPSTGWENYNFEDFLAGKVDPDIKADKVDFPDEDDSVIKLIEKLEKKYLPELEENEE
jgi:hypothetical protein